MSGASGAMLGTRFVATRESLAHEEYKRRILEADASDTVLTVCFDQGWPQAAHRVLINSTFREWEVAGSPPPGCRPREGEWIATGASGRIVKRYEDVAPLADTHGTVEAMPLYAGLSCAVINNCPPAGDVVARLWRDCEAACHSPSFSAAHSLRSQ
jgi:NAD(P)H-dependent flavin oxidoreductase YrpB (nitropropane dioxygenase family)